MTPQTYHPPKDIVSPIITTYGEHSISVGPEGSNAPLVIQTPGEPTWVLQGSELIQNNNADADSFWNSDFPSQVTLGEPPVYTSQTTLYGSGSSHSFPNPTLESDAPSALQLVLAVLLVYVGIKLIGLVFKGVGAVLSFVWSLITLPFRIIDWFFGLVFAIPRALARTARGSASLVATGGKAVGGTVAKTYESFAEAYNRASIEPGPALRRAKSGFVRAQRRAEAAGRRIGERLGRLGLNSDAHALAGEPRDWSERSANPWGANPSEQNFASTLGSDYKPEFPGYKVLSELPRGGSGARLYLARPRREHAKRQAERGIELPSQVVIKWFSLQAGAHMSGILREGRALDAAKQLGQVLEHESGQDGLFYVMPFVPGVTLDRYIAKLHGFEKGQVAPGKEQLSPAELEEVLSLSLDLLTELERFHNHGLWHKDVKPGNLIVHKGRLHVVDLGLLTPLASALTLTTHGTEYYRDPEMVRLAMRGAQVRDVDAAKFDLYSAGAVLFSMLEGTFPAHGNLSRLTRPCPPALSWIVRRAMSEHESRYASASAMRADLAYLLEHKDLAAIKPKHLPSWGSGDGKTAAGHALENEPSRRQSIDPLVEALESSLLAEEAADSDSEPGRRRSFFGLKCSKKSRRGRWFPAVLAVLLIGGALTVMRDSQNHSFLMVNAHSQPAPLPLGGMPGGSAWMGDGAGQRLGPGLRADGPEFKQWPSQKQASWAQEQVRRIFDEVPARRLSTLYLHGLPAGANGDQMAAAVTDLLARQDVKVRVVDPSNPNTEADLPLAAGASHLLDSLPEAGQPDTDATIQFFLEHPGVQGILDFQGQARPGRARVVINPMTLALGELEQVR